MLDEIDRFFKTIERCYNNYLTENQLLNPGTEQALQKDLNKKLLLKNKQNLKDDRGYFLKLVDKYRVRSFEVPWTLTVQKIASGNPGKFQLVDFTLPRASLRPDRKLAADDEIWTLMPYKNYTPAQKYEKYRKITTKLKKKQDVKEPKAHRPQPVASSLNAAQRLRDDGAQNESTKVTLFKKTYVDGHEEFTSNDFISEIGF